MSENTTTEVDGDATTQTTGAEAPATTEPRKRTRRQLLEREGEVAADFLETLLDIADLDGDIDLDIDGDRAAVAVVDSDEGRVPRRLVGQDGKVLEALQELTRLAVQSDTGDRSRLMLDVAGHRAARRAELVEIAGRAVTSVKESGESVDLDPMTAFERKVVHDEVLAAGLVSDSSGSEPRRFVVVHPAEEAGTDDTAAVQSEDSTVDVSEAPSE
ncbi:MAG: protein jag, partial [Janibacter sp.]